MTAANLDISIIALNKRIKSNAKHKNKPKVKDSYKHLKLNQMEVAYQEEDLSNAKKQTSGDDV